MRNAPKRLFRPKTQISGNEIFRQALQESPVHHLRDAASFRRAEIFVPGKCGLIKNVHHLMYWSVYKKRKNVLHINSSSPMSDALLLHIRWRIFLQPLREHFPEFIDPVFRHLHRNPLYPLPVRRPAICRPSPYSF